MKNIVLVNAHWNNRGDEAAIRAIVDQMMWSLKDVRIHIIFKANEPLLQFPYLEKVEYTLSKFLPHRILYFIAIYSNGRLGCNSDMKKIVDAVRAADLVVYAPGGAVISDRFWWKKQLEYLFPLALAEKNKIPVVLAAPSIGPFCRKRRYREKVLKKIDILCVREKISFDALRAAGITKGVYTTIDSAFLNNIEEETNADVFQKDELLKKFFEKYDKILGITITNLKWHVQHGKTEIEETIEKAFQGFISQLAKDHTGVLLIPQLFGNENDKCYLEKFNHANTFVLSDSYDCFFQQYVISKLFAVIGMRYHSNIFAAKMGVPFIPVIYEEKMQGFVDEAGWGKMSIQLGELSADVLMDKYLLLRKKYLSLKKQLDDKNIDWKNKALKTCNLMFDIINNL